MDSDNIAKYKCELCGMTFEKWQQKASHMKYAHGKSQEEYNKITSIGILNKLNLKLGEKKEFVVKCSTCGKEFIVIEREKQHPKKQKYYCNRTCANTHVVNTETKIKIGKSIHEAWVGGSYNNSNFGNNSPRFSSKSEREVRKYLKDKYGEKEVQAHRIKQYYDIRRAVDITIPKFNTVIEFDGIFHFKKIYTEDKFQSICEKDIKQNQFCEENFIKLIRIKYDVYDKNKKRVLDKIVEIIETGENKVYLLYDDI